MNIIGKYLIIVLLAASCAHGSDYIRNDSVRQIVDNIWHGEYNQALESVDVYYSLHPDDPLGYFLKGAIYQTISESYRNDGFKEIIEDNLNRAIKLCDSLLDIHKNNADYYFLKGSALGYRGLHKAFHGSWWSAFKDGLKCNSHLERALKIDSGYYDARWGLGAYYYYKTIKAKDFIWLPFVSDKRELGIKEIKSAIDNGFLAQDLAREGLLRIYFLEGQYDLAIALADSALPGREFMPNTLLYKAESLIGLDSLDEAEIYIDLFKESLGKSEYFDTLGVLEYNLLRARLDYKMGYMELAVKRLKAILELDDLRDENAYFKDTYQRAEEAYDRIK